MGEGREIYDGEGKRERRGRHLMVKERGGEERNTCDGQGEKGDRYMVVKGRGYLEKRDM